MNQATLLVIRGPDQGARFTVGETPVSIGRGVRSDIRILDTEVSRQHAILFMEDGAFCIRDRGSSNGTYVNGDEVTHARLRSGDQFQIGGTLVLFRWDAEETDESFHALKSIDLVETGFSDPEVDIVRQLPSEDSQATLTGGQPELAHTVENLRALYRISEEVITPAASLDQLLRRTLDLCIGSVGADRGCLLLSDPRTGAVEPQVYRHRDETAAGGRMPVSRSIVNYVVETKQGVRTSNAHRDRRFAAGQSILRSGIREAICVPMQGRYELMGTVYVDITVSPSEIGHEVPARFDDDHLRLLLAIGRQCALAVENDRYQTAYVQAERLAAVGQTISMLSHHIKNILQGVRGGSYLIDRGLSQHDEDLVRRGWGIVEKNQDRIYHLVMDMLTYGKERKPALVRSSLNEVVRDVCELMASRAEEHGVELQIECDETLEATTFDPDGLHRAVLNVVGNAVDALDTTEGGRVRIRTGRNPDVDEIFVEVADNGPGISEETLGKIFQVFESTKGARGTGLGLAVSRKILREHGGDIRVHSEVGAGSCFTLAWPRIEDDHEPTARHEVQSDLSGPDDS